MRRKNRIRISSNSAARKGGFLKFIFFLIIIFLILILYVFFKLK